LVTFALDDESVEFFKPVVVSAKYSRQRRAACVSYVRTFVADKPREADVGPAQRDDLRECIEFVRRHRLYQRPHGIAILVGSDSNSCSV
jgi:hypothetical protein